MPRLRCASHKTRRDLGRATRELRCLFGAACDRGVVRERVVDLAVLWTNRECGRDFRFEVLILQVEHRGAERMCFERTRVDLQCFFDFGGGFVELAGFECDRCFECECFDEVWID